MSFKPEESKWEWNVNMAYGLWRTHADFANQWEPAWWNPFAEWDGSAAKTRFHRSVAADYHRIGNLLYRCARTSPEANCQRIVDLMDAFDDRVAHCMRWNQYGAPPKINNPSPAPSRDDFD